MNISHNLVWQSVAGLHKKRHNYRILTFFPTLPHTHWERQAVHKTHDFEWNDFTKPDWATRGLRKNHSHHCTARVWCPVMLAWGNTRSFQQQGRKHGEKNWRSEVRGNALPSHPSGRKPKTELKFCENASDFWRAEHGGLGTFSTSNRLKMCCRSWERAPSSKCLSAAAISSNDCSKKVREKYLWICSLVSMSACFHIPTCVTHFTVMG